MKVEDGHRTCCPFPFLRPLPNRPEFLSFRSVILDLRIPAVDL